MEQTPLILKVMQGRNEADAIKAIVNTKGKRKFKRNAWRIDRMKNEKIRNLCNVRRGVVD